MDGSFVFKVGLTNEHNCSVLLFKKQGGEYRKTSYKLPIKGCCDFYNTNTFIIPDFQSHCDNCPKQSDNVCPFPAVSFKIFLKWAEYFNKIYFYFKLTYTVNKYELDIGKVPPVFEGDFRSLFQITRNNKVLAGYIMYATIIR